MTPFVLLLVVAAAAQRVPVALHVMSTCPDAFFCQNLFSSVGTILG